MGNQAGIIIRNVKNELFHSAKRLILNEVKGIECLPIDGQVKSDKYHGIYHLDRDKDIEIVVNLYKFYQNSYNTFRAIKTSRHHP